MTQADLTHAMELAGAKVPATAVAKIETGTRPTSVLELAAIGRVLDVDVASLVHGDDARPTSSVAAANRARFAAGAARDGLVAAYATYWRERSLALATFRSTIATYEQLGDFGTFVATLEAELASLGREFPEDPKAAIVAGATSWEALIKSIDEDQEV